MIHELKTHPIPFQAVVSGEKTFEVRVNDRNFQAGDELLLREYDPETRRYTGREWAVEVPYILYGGEYGLPDNICVMTLRRLDHLDYAALRAEVEALRAERDALKVKIDAIDKMREMFGGDLAIEQQLKTESALRARLVEICMAWTNLNELDMGDSYVVNSEPFEALWKAIDPKRYAAIFKPSE